MANKKITDLTAIADLSLDYLIEVVDLTEASASDRNKKATIDYFLEKSSLTTGTSSNYAATVLAYPTDAYSDFVPFVINIHTSSGTSSPTLNVNGLGGKTMVNRYGETLPTLVEGSHYSCIYNASLDQILVLIESNSKVTRSSTGTLTLSSPGKYIHTGSGATWTLTTGTAALVGREFDLFNDGTGAIVMAYSGGNSAVSTFGGNIDEGTGAIIFWDGTKWIVKQ